MSDITTEPEHTQPIELPLHTLPVADNWTGITDQKERRRIQNRLAQRAYRQRHTQKGRLRIKFFRPSDDKFIEAPGEKPVSLEHPVEPEAVPPRNNKPSSIEGPSQAQAPPANTDGPAPSKSGPSNALSSNSPNTDPGVQDIISHAVAGLNPTYPHQFRDFRISADHQYLDLIYYNVFRAFEVNTGSLGLTTHALTFDILSPFNSMTLEDPNSDPQEPMIPLTSNLTLSLPPSLQPTYLQITVPHHPFIDIFPSPRVRDNLIRAGDELDDVALCLDIMGTFGGVGNGFSGLVVWGDPWDPLGWEVTEHLVEKWAWVFEGVEDVLVGTNNWRQLRGLGELNVGA